LENNNISEVPRKEMLKFLQNGGTLKYTENGISLAHNVMMYPGQHVLDMGDDAVSEYLNMYPKPTVDPNEHVALLIGKQEAGKTSLGLALAGKINSSDDVKPAERTEAFDEYKVPLKEMQLNMVDIGGQDEYQALLALVGRDRAQYICVVQQSDLETEEKIKKAVGDPIDRVVDTVSEPNILVAISKTDMIQSEQEAEEKKAGLTNFLEGKQVHLRMIKRFGEKTRKSERKLG